MNNVYILPELPYGYAELDPHISEEQLKLHHQKHHQAYVNGTNEIIKKLRQARKDNADLDMKCTLKALSFNISGHLLHSLFWKNMAPDGGGEPSGKVAEALAGEFGSFESFKKEFTQAALSTEGSGWAALAFCRQTSRPLIMQIEKHNTNIYPTFDILLVLDVWEHAYYLDYKNERAKFVGAFWNIVNWNEVDKRLREII